MASIPTIIHENTWNTFASHRQHNAPLQWNQLWGDDGLSQTHLSAPECFGWIQQLCQQIFSHDREFTMAIEESQSFTQETSTFEKYNFLMLDKINSLTWHAPLCQVAGYKTIKCQRSSCTGSESRVIEHNFHFHLFLNERVFNCLQLISSSVQ